MSSKAVQGDKDKNWLAAHNDSYAGVHTFSQCMLLGDIHGDGEHKLVIADLGSGIGGNSMKLKVFKGTSLLQENTLIDLPTGVVSFYMDTNEPRTPAVAAASGPYIYVYKNMRPFFKFTLPTLQIHPTEADLWRQAKEDKIDVTILREMLENLRGEGATLTVRSQRFLQLNAHELSAFAEMYKHHDLKRQTVITCLATLKKSHAEEDAVSCLVLGTESNQVYVLDPEAFTVLSTMTLPSAPVFLHVSGLYDVEFRIVVVCRNACMYTIKRGQKSGKLFVQLASQPVGMTKLGKHVLVACMDDTVHCYTTKGKRLWMDRMPAAVTTLEVLDQKDKGFKALMVALANSTIRLYKDKYLVDSLQTEDVVTGMQFGRFGREDSTLVLTTINGGLIVKILRRSAEFKEIDKFQGLAIGHNAKLNVPKKTKLFIDQTQRERENAVSMHRTFQHDLYLLRLKTLRSFVKSLETSLSPISADGLDPLKLNAQVQGIGPRFKLSVNLQNTSISTPSLYLLITFLYDQRLYSLDKNLLQVPFLVPGLTYSFSVMVECLSDKGISDDIKVFVLKEGRSVPIITAVISMPVSEGGLLG